MPTGSDAVGCVERWWGETALVLHAVALLLRFSTSSAVHCRLTILTIAPSTLEGLYRAFATLLLITARTNRYAVPLS